MMKIKLLNSTNCDGRRVKAGDVIDASEKDGRFLVLSGFAEEYTEPVTLKSAPTNRMIKSRTTRGVNK